MKQNCIPFGSMKNDRPEQDRINQFEPDPWLHMAFAPRTFREQGLFGRVLGKPLAEDRDIMFQYVNLFFTAFQVLRSHMTN